MSPKKILLFAIGPVGGALIGLISVPILAWYFSQDDIGKMALIPIIITFSSLFFSLGLDQAYVREYHETDNKLALFKTAFLPGFFFIIATAIYFLFYNDYLPLMMFDEPSVELNILILSIIICSFIIRFISLEFRMNEQGIIYSISQFLPKLVFLLLILAFIQLNYNKNIHTLLMANAIGLFITCIFLMIKFESVIHIFKLGNVNKQELKKILAFGLPLAIGGFAFWGLTSIDRILLRYLSNYEELAIYSVALSFSAAAGILQSIFTTVWIPIAYKWIKEGVEQKKIDGITQYVLFIVTIVFCLIGLFSWIISYLLPNTYNNVQWIIMASIACPLFYTLSETTVIGINISRKSTLSMLATFFAFLSNVGLNFLLIPQYGAGGAALSSCVSYLFLFILRTEFSIIAWKKIPRFKLYVYPMILTIGAFLSVLISKEIKWLSYLYWMTILITTIFSFKKEYKSSIEFVINIMRKKKTT